MISSSAWTMSHLPLSTLRMYSAFPGFPRSNSNLIKPIHSRSTLKPISLKSAVSTHAMAASRRGMHRLRTLSVAAIVPQQTPLNLTPALANPRGSRTFNQFYRQHHRCATIVRPTTAVDTVSIQPLTFRNSRHGSEARARQLIGSGISGLSLSQQSRTFVTSSVINYSQPYFAMKNSQGDTLRIHLTKSRNFVGIRSTRCQREYNQDRYKVVVLNPLTPSPELGSASMPTPTSSYSSPSPSPSGHHNHHPHNSTEAAQMDANHKTLFYFAVFDGHGGSNTCDFLTAHLDGYIDEAKPEMVPGVVNDLRKLGGYFRTFRPQVLEPFFPSDFEEKHGGKRDPQQRRVHIKGKGGRVRPMVFIPHPNATEEDQQEDLEFLSGHVVTADSRPIEPTEEMDREESGKETKTENYIREGEQGNKRDRDEDSGEYDEDEDPYVIARRRYLNKTSPLPEGTTAYFSKHRSEYENLVIRERQPGEGDIEEEPEVSIPSTMTLEQRLCLSFLRCDAELVRDKYRDGSTASTVVVQSKGAFWDTKDDLDLIIAHVGDTRILLCESPRGECVQLTTDHHPDAIVESERIRKMAAYVSSDSFGENMFLGQVANTRALGDIAMKRYGVSGEPEIIRRTVKAKDAAFLVLVSDGITGVMSNQEIVDCVKLESDPTDAAANVLNLAEQLGAEDNCTVMVVRLPAWGTKMPDLSKDLREFRWQSEAQHSRARRR